MHILFIKWHTLSNFWLVNEKKMQSFAGQMCPSYCWLFLFMPFILFCRRFLDSFSGLWYLLSFIYLVTLFSHVHPIDVQLLNSLHSVSLLRLLNSSSSVYLSIYLSVDLAAIVPLWNKFCQWWRSSRTLPFS